MQARSDCMDAIDLVKGSGGREVLAVLFRFPERDFTISELGREAGVPFSAARRLVKKWEPAGIVETRLAGRSVLVRLRKTPYAKNIMKLLGLGVSPQAFTVSALRALLAKDKKIKEAHLFGSVASGKETPSSDIDVAILSEKGFDADGLMLRAYKTHGAKLVPIVFTNRRELGEFLKGKKEVKLV